MSGLTTLAAPSHRKNDEDAEVELDRHLLFSLEDELRLRGANYVAKPNWAPHVQVSAALMTDQSPASAAPLVPRG